METRHSPDERRPGTITEVCQQYADGRLRRDEIVEVLSMWDYRKRGSADEFGDYEDSPEGTVQEVMFALDAGLIDRGILDEVGWLIQPKDNKKPHEGSSQ